MLINEEELKSLPQRTRYEKNNEYFFIYSVTNVSNGKRYIGRCVSPEKRARTHMSLIRNHKHSAITDYEDDYVFEILESNVRRENRKIEKDYMGKYRTYDSQFGYNTHDMYFKKRWYKCLEDS